MTTLRPALAIGLLILNSAVAKACFIGVDPAQREAEAFLKTPVVKWVGDLKDGKVARWPSGVRRASRRPAFWSKRWKTLIARYALAQRTRWGSSAAWPEHRNWRFVLPPTRQRRLRRRCRRGFRGRPPRPWSEPCSIRKSKSAARSLTPWATCSGTATRRFPRWNCSLKTAIDSFVTRRSVLWPSSAQKPSWRRSR